MHDELISTETQAVPAQRPGLPAHAAQVHANALDLAEQALAHEDVAMAADAFELAELLRRTNGRLLPPEVDLDLVRADARRVVHERLD